MEKAILPFAIKAAAATVVAASGFALAAAAFESIALLVAGGSLAVVAGAFAVKGGRPPTEEATEHQEAVETSGSGREPAHAVH